MKMLSFYLIVFWPHVAGFLAALAFAVIVRHRSTHRFDGLTRALTIIGAAVALLIAIAPLALQIVNMQTQLDLAHDTLRAMLQSPMRFAFSFLAAGFTVAVLLVAPIRTSPGTGANLARRSIRSFTSPVALVTIAVLTLISAGVAIAAGRLSSADKNDNYRMYSIDSGVVSGSTDIYGWYYSIPTLIALGALLVLALACLARLARPSLGGDAEREIAWRRSRSSVVTASVTAALLLHLGYVCASLAGTAGMRIGANAGAGGTWVSSWPTFAALEPALRTTGLVLECIGIAVWAYLFWRAVFGNQRA